MLVMPANNGKWQVHYWQGLYGGLGHLYGPGRTFAPMPLMTSVNGSVAGSTSSWPVGSALVRPPRSLLFLAVTPRLQEFSRAHAPHSDSSSRCRIVPDGSTKSDESTDNHSANLFGARGEGR